MTSPSMSIVLRGLEGCEALCAKLNDVLLEIKPTIGFFFHDWGRLDRGPGVTAHMFWEPVHPGLEIRLVCDDVLQTSYISVVGSDGRTGSVILDELSQHFETVPLAELRAKVSHGEDEASWVRLCLGIRDDWDEESFALIVEGLSSPDITQRRGAAKAAAILRWKQLDEPVRGALARTQDAEERGALESALREIAGT